MNCKISRLVVFSTIFLPFLGIAALTATTAQTIQGERPQFKTSNRLAESSSFTVNGQTYKGFDSSYTSLVTFSSLFKLNDFTINGIDDNDFSAATDYDDRDGDVPRAINPLDAGTFSYRWLKSDATEINASDYGNQLSAYTSPLTLEITNKNVKLYSQYGAPNVSLPEVFTQKYLIHHQSGIFALRPKSLDNSPNCQWVDYVNGDWQCLAIGSGNVRPSEGGGYFSEYIPNVGFSPNGNGTDKFPTTAFKGAEFKVIMTGNQADYTFSISPVSAGVNIGANSGVVTFVSKPTSSITITATHISSVSYTYTFTINTWVVPQSSGALTYNVGLSSAVAQCGSENNILTRADMTNSPIATGLIDQDWEYKRNYGTRGIGSLYSEWGYLAGYNLSDWVSAPYWTKDRRSNWASAIHFFVHSNDGGYVGYKYDHENDTPGPGMRVACRN